MMEATATGLRVRSLRANTLFALLGDLVGKASWMIVLAAAARLLDTGEMARLGVALSAATILALVCDAGVSTVIIRDGAAAPTGVRSLVWASLRMRLIPGALLLAAAVGTGAATGSVALAVAAATYAAASAVNLSLFAQYRAAQDLAREARARAYLGAGSVAAGLAAAALGRTAADVMIALAAAQTIAAILLSRRTAAIRSAGAVEAAPGLRRLALAAAPFAAMGIATIAYARSGTLFLGAVSTPRETASYTLAATIALGLLAVPNAITTGLLPRLAAEPDGAARREVTRGALGAGLGQGLVVLVAGAAAAPALVPILFGARYHGAVAPLIVLLASNVLTAAATIIGTLIIADRRTRRLSLQVAASLVANLALSTILIPAWGAAGAALSLLVTEVVAIGVLAPAYVEAPSLPRLRRPRLTAAALPALGALAVLGPLYAISWRSRYSLRIIGDTPTYLSLIRHLAVHPLSSSSPFFAGAHAGDEHSSPYLQLIALIWRAVGPYQHGRLGVAPIRLDGLLMAVGVVVTLVLAHAAYLWAGTLAGRRAAWLVPAVTLVLLGPPQLLWATDFSLNGILYAPYFPQNLALALMLYTLVGLARTSRGSLAGAVLLAAGTMTTHPFTGLLLIVLATGQAVCYAWRGDARWRRGPVIVVGGYLLGLAWPCYSLSAALGESGIPALAILAVAGAAPVAASRVSWRPPSLDRMLGWAERAAWPLAAIGTLVAIGLAVWTIRLLPAAYPDPLVHTNRLALYWVDGKWRWSLMLCCGFVGIAGLARLARRGNTTPLLWFGGCMAIGLAGTALSFAGIDILIWYRFILLCQIPLALGVAVVLASSEHPWLRLIVVLTLVGTGAFKVATLVAAPQRNTYFGTRLQPDWGLGRSIPLGGGGVASDPYTSYLIPAATGDPVLTVGKEHTTSAAELAAAERGYALLHRFFATGSSDVWWSAAQTMYRQGIRFVVVDKFTSLSAPNLDVFSQSRTPFYRGPQGRRLGERYQYRLRRVGTLIADNPSYAVYRLDGWELAP